MNIEKAIRLADEVKPNALSTELKLHYLSEVEGILQSEVMLLSSADIITYTEDDLDAELIVKAPYDKIYLSYLIAMIDFANGEYNKYTNTIARFNTELAEYTAWYAQRFHPIDGKMEESGYYISAYAIAMMHGFKGSEAEWLDSLKGEPGESRPGVPGAAGDTAEFRYNENVLEWKYVSEGAGAWRALIDVSEVTQSAGEARSAATAAAIAAESAAGDRQAAQDAAAAAAKSALEAAGAAGGGVSSFNGRSGVVNPAAGDYTAGMVGADPAGSASGAVSAHEASATAHDGVLARAPVCYQISLAADSWDGDESTGYSQTVVVGDVLGGDRPFADIYLDDDAAANEARLEAYSLITRIVTSAGSVTVYASDVPAINIILRLEVIR